MNPTELDRLARRVGVPTEAVAESDHGGTDTDLAAAARIVTALADVLDATCDWDGDVTYALRTFGSGPEDASASAALLAAVRRELPEPRVWPPGDTVPAGVWFLDEFGDVTKSPTSGYRPDEMDEALVEVLVPDFAAAVAAEQARRSGGAA